MLTAYINAALARATYDEMEDGAFYGEIPGLQGVYASAATLDACHEELQSALEDWLLFGLSNRLPIPPFDGIRLTAEEVT